MAEPKRVAFVISTSDCELEEDLLSQVVGVNQSARAVRKCLESYGFRTLEFPNRVDASRIENTISMELAGADDAFFYYIGHGLKEDGELFLTLKKTVIANLQRTSLAFKNIYRILKQSDAKNTLIALDCCHAAAGLVAANDLLQSIHCENAYCIAAAQAHEPAIVNDDGTLFSGYFVEVLESGPDKNDGDTFSIAEVGDQIKTKFEQLRHQGKNVPTVVDLAQSTTAAYRFTLTGLKRIPKDYLKKLVANSVGVRREFPPDFSDHLELLGMFCAKQLVWRLTNELEVIERDLKAWHQEVTRQAGTLKVQESALDRAFNLSNELISEVASNNELNWRAYHGLTDAIDKQLDAFCGFVKRCSENSDSLDHVPLLESVYIDELQREFSVKFEVDSGQLINKYTARQWCQKLYPLVVEKLNNWKKRSNILWEQCCKYFGDVQ